MPAAAGGDVTIRPFEPRDTDAVVAAFVAASELAHPFLAADFLAGEADNIRNVYLGASETWVAEADGAVVGFVALIGDEIAGLFLDPRHHGRGIGRALADRAAHERGRLRVEVFRDNSIGRRFYERYGFVATEEYFHDYSGQATMRMQLQRPQD